ncbi:hypothetical protein [Rhodanobacter sp. BL-MT-08]
MTIISLHLPKTAGTSFRVSLANHFGDRYRGDYDDQAISKTTYRRRKEAMLSGAKIFRQGLAGVDCVHGHFLPFKYRPLSLIRDLTFITWMREPAARLISHYHYWQESYSERTAAPHHRQVVEERWTLEEFCLSEKFQNIYTQYLWCFPLENFAFIGISEHYQEDLLCFARQFLSSELVPQRENITAKTNAYREFDQGFLKKVRAFHAKDVRLYERALQLREARLSSERPGR